MRTALLLAVGVAILGCGSAKEGGACKGSVYHCDGHDTVLECRDGHWLGLPCSGPDGCAAVPGGITCDISLNLPGEGCPTAMEGTGFCRGTPPSLFSCRGLQLVKLQDCSSCVTNTSSIVCTP